MSLLLDTGPLVAAIDRSDKHHARCAALLESRGPVTGPHHDFDPEQFTAADQAALLGEWSWLGRVAGQAIEDGPAGMLEDELACRRAVGFDPAEI